MKYKVTEDGEWFPVMRGGHKIACCDCGLVHNFNFRTRDGDLEVQFTRDKRATGQVRRHMKQTNGGKANGS